MRDKIKLSSQKFLRWLSLSMLEFFLVLSLVFVKSIVFVPLLYFLFRFGFHRPLTVEVWYAYTITAFWFQRVPEKVRDTIKEGFSELREIICQHRRVSRNEASKETR